MNKQKKQLENELEFVQGEDYYFDEQGLLVFTKAYLKKRGTCCHNACKHCPYKDCFCYKERRKKQAK